VDADGNLVPAEASSQAGEFGAPETALAIATVGDLPALAAPTETPPAIETVATEAPAKPKRSRKKAEPATAKRTAKTAPAIEASEGTAPSAAEPAPAKPKRTRAPAKKTAVAAVAESAAKPVTVHEQIPAPLPKPPLPAVVTAQQVSETAPIVDAPAQAAKDEARPVDPSAPPRKGWWNRFL
jgi:ribonuclease E